MTQSSILLRIGIIKTYKEHWCWHWAAFFALLSVTCSVLGDGIDKVFTLDIPTSDAALSLKNLSRQTGHSILFQSADVEGVKTNPISGRYDIQQALDALLNDVALSGHLEANEIITISQQPRSAKPENIVNTRKTIISSLMSLLTSITLTHPVNAANNNEHVLEEVIVTAQKRAQSINDVPMSISALSADQMVKQGVNNVADLQKVVSGFRYSESFAGTPVYYIRGIGFNETTLGSQPNVAVYIDEVAIPFPIMTAGAALDLERVEVLKGPQGTLFGQNTTGGAINYIAAKPGDNFEAGVTVSYGTFESKTIDGYISGPLSDTLGARLALKAEKSGPWQESITSNDELGRKDKINGRLLLDWQASEDLSVGINLSAFNDDSEVNAAQYSGFNYLQPLTVPLLDIFFPGATAVIENSQLPTGDARAADWGPGIPKNNNRYKQASARVDYALSEHTKLTYIVSKSDYEMDRFADGDGIPILNSQLRTLGEIDSTAHELRLSGDMFGDKGQWMIGGNYDTSEVDQVDETRFDIMSNSFALGPTNYAAGSSNLNNQKFTSESIFSALDFDLSEVLSAHVSARYTNAKDEFSGCTADSGDGSIATAVNNAFAVFGSNIAPGGCLTGVIEVAEGGARNIERTLDENNTSWRAGLDWSPMDNQLLYINISKGYKSGSFPALSSFSSVQFTPVTQESVVAYETGFKATLLDRKLQLNGAVFYYDYENKQVRGRVPVPVFGPLEALVNVPESSLKGAEIEMIWKFHSGWTASLNSTYLDTEIGGNYLGFDDFGVAGNFGGEPFPNTPKLQVNADLAYEWHLTDDLNAYIGIHESYQAETHNGFGQDSRLVIDAYSLIDARIGISADDGSWSVQIWGNNLSDEYYWINQVRVADTRTRFAGMPRTFGASVTYRFQ